MEDTDTHLKANRLKEWCKDINQQQKKCHFDFVFVEEDDFEKYKPETFAELEKNFRKFREPVMNLIRSAGKKISAKGNNA